MKLIFLSVLLLAKALFANAQEPGTEIFSNTKLEEDFKIFRDALEEGHPGLYRYRSKTEMDGIFNAAQSSLNSINNKKDFQLLLSKVIGKIGCGHTRVTPSRNDLESFDKGATMLPFQAYYYKGNIYVQKNYTNLNDNDFLGAQILSINGQSMNDFLKQYLTIVSSDGANQTNKYAWLQNTRHFSRNLYYLYGYPKSYTVTYKPFNSKTVKKTTLQGLLYDSLVSIKKLTDTPLKKSLQLSINTENKTAYLKVGSFDKGYLKTEGLDFVQFVKDAFAKMDLNGIQNLILDLRDNGGGSDEFGRILFSYFIKEDFRYYDSLTMNRDSFNFFKYTQLAGMRPPADMIRKSSRGNFDIIKYANYGIQKPLSPTFTGNLYVLINGLSFSTTSECISMIHFKTKAKFIGEESGGGYYGDNGGLIAELTLPNSDIMVRIPLVKYVMAVNGYKYKDRGLIPYYQLVPTVQDRIKQKDSQLQLAYMLMGGSNKNARR